MSHAFEVGARRAQLLKLALRRDLEGDAALYRSQHLHLTSSNKAMQFDAAIDLS